MYGSASYGSIPYGSSGGVTAFDYAAMLEGSRDELVFTAELTVWEIGGSAETKLYFGSAEWSTAPTDVPASQPFDGRLTTVLQWSRSIVGDRIGIDYQSGDATIAFLNPDGAYDDIVDGYAIDGRAVTVRVGRKTDDFASHLVIFRGVGVDWSADTDTVTITARDRGFLLDVPAQPNVYAGTGGAEGGSDLAGKRKPLMLGDVDGAPPATVDATNLIYQLHDGAIWNLSRVYDRGAQLSNLGSIPTTYAELLAATVTAGGYKYSNEIGMIKLGAEASGILLTRCERAADETVADAILYLIDRTAALADDEIDLGSFDALRVNFGDNGIGRFVGSDDAASVADLVRELMAGKGGWAGFLRDGTLSVGVLTAPTGAPVANFARDEGDIIDLRREAMPSGVWPPPWRWRVAWGRNATVFTDFAGTVPSLTRAFFATPYRLAEAKDLTILDDYRRAQDPPPVEAHFDLEADAQAEADRLLALYSSGYRLYRMTLGRRALALDLGDVISVTWPRLGLDAGKLLRVVAIEDRIDLSDGSGVETVEVVAFG